VKTRDFFRVFGIRRGRSKMGTSIERQRGKGGGVDDKRQVF